MSGNGGPHVRRLVLALVIGRHDRARIAGSLRAHAEVRFVATVAEFWECWTSGGVQPSMVLVEPQDNGGTSTVPIVARLRILAPHLPLIGYCELAPGVGGGVVPFVRSGVHDVIFRGIDDEGIALRSVLAQATRGCAVDRALDAFRNSFGEPPPVIVEYGLTHGAGPLSVEAAARALGVHRRTLVNYAACFGTTPSRLLAWCRVLLAAALLEDRALSVEQVAAELDFPSVTALRNLMRRHVHATPTAIRGAGGVRGLARRFADELRRRGESGAESERVEESPRSGREDERDSERENRSA